MGFFDKLKSITNKITGNSAKVDIVVDSIIYRNSSVPVTINVEVKESGITIDKVYLEVRAMEYVKIVQHEVVNGNSVTKERTNTSEIHRFSFEVSSSQYLEANKKYTWDTEFSIPEGAQATYNAYPREVRWAVFAGLDTTGNDPDSGWKDLFVN
jgi:hypothetical protein